jgi:hypothetical protein
LVSEAVKKKGIKKNGSELLKNRTENWEWKSFCYQITKKKKKEFVYGRVTSWIGTHLRYEPASIDGHQDVNSDGVAVVLVWGSVVFVGLNYKKKGFFFLT